LIQEDYDAAKPDREMGKGLLPYAVIWLLMTFLIHVRFFCEMVLAEGDVSPRRHQLID
jgi:hypothetical protein